MIHNKKYRSHSWSEWARLRANHMIASGEYNIQVNGTTRKEIQNWMMRTVGNSVYTTNLITKRSAKRLHRKGWL